MKRNLESKVERILSQRITPVSALYLCNEQAPKNRKRINYKLLFAFLAVFVFCFFLTAADYANRDLGNFGSRGLFSLSVIGEKLNIVFFNEDLSVTLPPIAVSLLEALNRFFNSF